MAMNGDMSSDYHGKHGILKTGYSYMTPIAKLVLKAGKELGYKQRDYNAEDMIGIHQAQNTVYNGWRQSSNEFLKQAADQRPERLHIVGRAHVRQVVFEADTNGVRRATGVIYVRDGVEVNVRARNEVILSAGSVGSPQLLLLSGIGPKTHLKEKEIPIIADLPGVGKNLQDHVMTPALFYGPNVPPRSSIDDYTIFTAMPQYLIGNGGPLTYSGLDVTSFIRTPLAKSKSPDIQMTQLSAQLTLGSLDLNERLFNFG
uniref:Glucose-methanol-choline oxidoreductase N-terminal domain-containing protein n=1 Tax=Ciona savignyi TaxID=51511 RepID=H2Y9T7_CIOSA